MLAFLMFSTATSESFLFAKGFALLLRFCLQRRRLHCVVGGCANGADTLSRRGAAADAVAVKTRVRRGALSVIPCAGSMIALYSPLCGRGRGRGALIVVPCAGSMAVCGPPQVRVGPRLPASCLGLAGVLLNGSFRCS